MRVLFCGGRDFSNRKRVSEVFDKLLVTFACHGGARGADTLCAQEASRRGIPLVCYPANWQGEGDTAGPRRNQRMLDEFKPELVVAFPGGTGTADMIRRATEAGITVKRARGE